MGATAVSASPIQPTAPAPSETIHVPLKIATITDQAVAETIKSVHDGYSNKIGARISSGDGGSARIFGSVERGQMSAAGYVGASRKGLEIGAELTFDLNPK